MEADPLALLLDDFVLHDNARSAIGFPLPGAPGFLETPTRPGGHRFVALDAEMCLTAAGPTLIRITAVDENGKLLLDEKVLPGAPVLDWQTAYTGLGPDDFTGVTFAFEDAQRAVCDLVHSGCVVVGHALWNDMRALRIVHTRFIDTLSLYATRARVGSGSSSLRELTRHHLGRTIQVGAHDSAEDARAALDLARHRASRVLPTRSFSALPPANTPLDLKTLLARLRLDPAHILNVYQFGSRVYGTSTEQSDWDFLIVTDLEEELEEHLSQGDVNAALYDRTTFARLLDANQVWALESQYLPPSAVWKEDLDLRGAFRIDPALLRESTCTEAGFAWNKARRVMEKEGDLYRGKKNIFHALRFLLYGAQLARDGRISDYAAANNYLAELRARSETDWRTYRAAYEGEYRRLRKEFTRLVPHEGKHLKIREEGDSATPPAALPRPTAAAPPADQLATVRLALRDGLERVMEEHRVSLRSHGEFPALVQLFYSVEAATTSPVATECRGLILDATDGYRVVAFPFARFFNHGEPQAAALDWSSTRVFEKVDGSLAILYWYAEKWRVASRTNPDGSGQMGWYSPDGPLTFAELFWQLWERLGYCLPPSPAEGAPLRCYLFELATNRHQIVVRHEADSLVLHGARNLHTLEELDPVKVARDRGWQAPRVIEGLKGPEEVQTLAESLDPLRAEGYVACDAAFRRVKFKCPGYVRLSGAIHGSGRQQLGGVTSRRMIELVRHGATGEFIAYFPEHAEGFRATQEAWNRLCNRAADTYAALASLPPAAFGREVNALRPQDRSWPRVIFALRHGATAGDALRQLPSATVERLLHKLEGL